MHWFYFPIFHEENNSNNISSSLASSPLDYYYFRHLHVILSRLKKEVFFSKSRLEAELDAKRPERSELAFRV